MADKAEVAIARLAAGFRFGHRILENSLLRHNRGSLAIGASIPFNQNSPSSKPLRYHNLVHQSCNCDVTKNRNVPIAVEIGGRIVAWPTFDSGKVRGASNIGGCPVPREAADES
jgi:hypothetical protein